MVYDYVTGEPRRVLPGEAETWDDATVNAIFWVGGDIAKAAAAKGDPCAIRYGCVVGRWQLLLGVDVATDYVTGWQWVIRERASYRQTDPLAAWATVWGAANGAPERIITERGTWESGRVKEVLSIWGLEQVRSYHPRTKLVESVFNRLWTRLGMVAGHVGRGRAENEHGDKLLRQCRSGSVDPRTACYSLEEIDETLRRVVHAHNTERIESKHYGKWVPAERWGAEAAQHRRPLKLSGPEGWACLPERRLLKVRRNGMVACAVDTGWGYSEQYAWNAESLWKYVGREVAVYFDPNDVGGPATIVDPTSRTVLERYATSVQGDAAAGSRIRSIQAASVRREARALRPDGTLASWRSEILRTDGSQYSSGIQRSQGSSSAMPQPPREVPAVTPPARRDQGTVSVDGQPLSGSTRATPARPEPRYLPSRRDDEIDIDEIERLEAEARQRGLLTSH
jgi:hypothetical protein